MGEFLQMLEQVRQVLRQGEPELEVRTAFSARMRPNPQLGQLAVLGIQKVGLSPLGLGNLYDGQQKAGRLAQVWLKLSLCCPSAEECWELWERCAQRLLFHPQLKLTQIECSEAVWQKDWNGVVLPVKLCCEWVISGEAPGAEGPYPEGFRIIRKGESR